MKLRLVKNVYWVDFRDPTGKRHRLTTGVSLSASDPARAKAEAYAEAARIVQKYMAAGDTPFAPVVLVPTLAKLMQTKLDDHWSRMAYGMTMRYTVQKLKREIGAQLCTEVTPKWWRGESDKWIKAGKAVSTINRYRNCVTGALSLAVEDKHIAVVPELVLHSEARLVRERYMFDYEEPRILGWLQKMQADDLADRRWAWEYLENLFVFLLDTGFRFTEAFVFTLVDGKADLEHGCTKNTIGRRVPLTARALKAAQYLLSSEHHRELGRLSKARPKSAWDWCAHRFERCLRALDINTPATSARRRLTFHCLRHTCASRMLSRGINIVVVSKWLGHSSIKITMRYLKLEADAFAGVVLALQPDAVSPPAAVTTRKGQPNEQNRTPTPDADEMEGNHRGLSEGAHRGGGLLS